MKHFIVALLILGLAGWAGMSMASHVPVPDHCFENGPFDCNESNLQANQPNDSRKAVRASYRRRYVKCRELLQLKPRELRRPYRQMRKCHSKLRRRSTWAVGLTIRMVFPESEWENAKAVATCENRGTGLDNRRARRGRAGERSHFQIHPIHFNWVDEDRLEKDALYATRIAHRIWSGKGWSPWTCGRILGIG